MGEGDFVRCSRKEYYASGMQCLLEKDHTGKCCFKEEEMAERAAAHFSATEWERRQQEPGSAMHLATVDDFLEDVLGEG